MRFLLSIVAVCGLVFAALWAFGLVSVTQTREAALPQIEAKPGTLPEFEVKAAKVEVGTENRTVEVPTVTTEERTVKTPAIKVEKP